MSVQSVRDAIAKAVVNKEGCSGPRVTTREANTILKTARADGKISNGERKLISDLYENRNRTQPGQAHTLACPETSRPSFDTNGAKNVEQFLYPMMTLAIPETP